MTPSNHRVHHARNSIYVDRNYGGVFIIWDRLFGSFQEELVEEPVVFGLRKPLQSWNPIWANVHVYWHLLRDSQRAEGILNKLKVWFMPPGWMPPGSKSSCKLRKAEIDLTSKYNPAISRFASIYTFLQFILTVGLSLFLLLNTTNYSYVVNVLAVLFLAYSFMVHGFWLEARPTAHWHELTRLALLILLLLLAQLSLIFELMIIAATLTAAISVWYNTLYRTPAITANHV